MVGGNGESFSPGAVAVKSLADLFQGIGGLILDHFLHQGYSLSEWFPAFECPRRLGRPDRGDKNQAQKKNGNPFGSWRWRRIPDALTGQRLQEGVRTAERNS